MTKPTATGNLATTPLCELLVYSLTQSLSGSLVLECPDRRKHAVLFHFGTPVKVRVDDPSTRLGQILLERGYIDEAALLAAEAGPEAQLFGQRLFSQGAIDAATLAEALEAQLLEQLSWLSQAPPATAFGYYDHADLLEHWGGEQLQVDPLAAIWRTARAYAPDERIARACQGLADKTLRLHPASRIGRFGFEGRERAVLDVLRVKPQTLGELEATGLMERSILRRMMYVLVLTRHLDTGTLPLGVAAQVQPVAVPSGPRRPPSTQRRAPARFPQPKPPSAEPTGSSPAKRDITQTGRFLTRDEIEAKLQSLDQLSHYELLEVERGAASERVGEAFSALARRWHPDRLSPEHNDLREAVTRCFARMTEAHRVLGQNSSREEYERSLQSDLDQETEQAQVVKVLRAADAFQKAEILLRKRDLEGAERFAHQAYTSDKDQPEYAALYAWIRARRADASESDVSEALGLLKSAVAKQSDNVKIRYYLGCVFKLAGHAPAALREFRFVAENDPSNLEAVRELRLHDMRKNNPPEQSESAGLFGRFFKR